MKVDFQTNSNNSGDTSNYDANYWNFNAIMESEEGVAIMISSTNNRWERFNRHLNDLFPTAHPTMQVFSNEII
jgi:hypothetical protein